ncbi:MAG: nucleoid-associated protein [Erysipelotrichaceae bacterium]
MEIKKIVLHQILCDQNKSILSDHLLEVSAEKSFMQIERKLIASFASNNRKKSRFASQSVVKEFLLAYHGQNIEFMELSTQLAKRLLDVKYTNGLFQPSAFVFAEVVMDDIRYLLGMDSGLKKAMRLSMVEEEGTTRNMLEEYQQLFSPSLSQRDFIFCYDVLNDELTTIEAPVRQEKETYNILSTLFLEAVSEHSFKQGMKLLEQMSNEVIETYELNPLEIRPKLKSFVYEQVKEEGKVEMNALAETVFEDHFAAKQKLLLACEQASMSELDALSQNFSKAEGMVKFVTDLGIEVSVPLEYVHNKKVFDLQISEDELGTITISNIATVITK